MDYRIYRFSKKEWVIYIGQGITTIGMLGYFFYRSLKLTLLMSPLIVVLIRRKQKELCIRRRQELTNQFKEMMGSLNSSLQAGYSMENAFHEAYKDMVYYYQAESLIGKELFWIRTGMQNGRQVEELLQDLGERSGVEDILDFANILAIGKKSGGNINEILQSGISVIEEKIQTKQEIQILLSAKKLEVRIMSVIPFLIMLYIGITSKGYFNPLYRTVGGNIIMTICLAVYLAAVEMAKRITEIEI